MVVHVALENFINLAENNIASIRSGQMTPGLDAAIVLLQTQLAQNKLMSVPTVPNIPLKSARRPRPIVTKSSESIEHGSIEDLTSPNLNSTLLIQRQPTTPSATSIRDSLWSSPPPQQSPSLSSPDSAKQHSKQSSYSSTDSSNARSDSSDSSSRKSSFDWDTLDTGIISRIEVGLKSEHRLAAQTYKVSRETRRMLRIQKHANLQMIWI